MHFNEHLIKTHMYYFDFIIILSQVAATKTQGEYDSAAAL